MTDIAVSRIALVGARGKMGRLFADRSRELGIEVRELDRPLTADKLAAAITGADVVCLSVPVGAMAVVSALVAAHMKPPQILADLCSVKALPLRDMLDAYPGPVVGTHPLFGPVPPGGVPCRVALTPGRDDGLQDATAVVQGWFERLGFPCFITTATEHDTAMAYVQALNFVTTVAYLAAKPAGLDMSRYVTPSFQRRLDAAKKLVLEDAPLFTALFEANPQAQDTVRSFSRYLGIAAGGDIDLLVSRASHWWDE